MRSVSIAELRNGLSAYLHAVRAGEEILVRNRRRPIAKIVPLPDLQALTEEERELVATGQLRAPRLGFTASFWEMPAPRLSLVKAAAAIVAEREETP